MDDMKKMKSNHVKVIDRIQDQYKSVEDDIQVDAAQQLKKLLFHCYWCVYIIVIGLSGVQFSL